MLVVCACEPVAVSPAQPTPIASIETTPVRGDACQHDIPDCEAACALREVHRTEHLDWFDRRCAAVVLGKNPDRAVPMPSARPIDTALPTCEPPYTLDDDGRKHWKRDCFE
jgi:hypothetical protein